MPTRDRAPIGSPCWVDLWTSDVEGSRKFYGELFGWEAQEPSAEFGGYFMFTRNEVPIAGGMGDMGDLAADNSWKIYLTTDDIAKTVEAAESDGAQIISPSMAVADLGTQAVLVDPTGAHLGTWQPGTFPGFTVLNEHGAPSWFELFTRDHAAAVAFYRSVFHWETDAVGDSDEFRYTTMRDPSGDGELAGIMDASTFLPDGVPAHWSVYWEVDNADSAVAKVKALGGSVVSDAVDTPYGRLATAADPAGAQFKLRTPNP
ncbi:MAG TPA: VOC family protein [Acidimicrobiia bacterium]|jgi:predicted enzyme related to lactoylglutathione lyase